SSRCSGGSASWSTNPTSKAGKLDRVITSTRTSLISGSTVDLTSDLRTRGLIGFARQGTIGYRRTWFTIEWNRAGRNWSHAFALGHDIPDVEPRADRAGRRGAQTRRHPDLYDRRRRRTQPG